MQSPDKPFIVVDGVTYINEELVRQLNVIAKITSKAVDSVGLPLIEMNLGDGSITIRHSAPEAENPEQGISGQHVVDSSRWAIKLEQNGSGQYVAAGIGIGVSEFQQASAKGADAVLRYLSEAISSSKLATDLRRSIDDGNTDLAEALAEAGGLKLEMDASKDRQAAMEEVVREVLRKEIRPGGLLWRR
ncbi:hypothetical protein [Pseudomonas mosselii]|uniref:hypothetical protein n=1 Tax=Pseudomonas mosselii TaxID=78327 RepID=UPI003F38D04D